MKIQNIRIIRKFIEADDKKLFILSKILLVINVNYHFIKVHISDRSKIYLHASKMSICFFIRKKFKSDELQFYRTFLRKNDIFIDIGANIGALSLSGAERVSPGGKVFSVEAIPKVFNYLKENIELNNFTSVITPYNYALGNFEKDVQFYVKKYGDDLGSLSSSVHQANRSITVKMVRGDILFNSLDRITLLKLDVEGAELIVFQGFSRLFDMIDFIIFEYEDSMIKSFNGNFTGIHDFLHKYGYDIYKVSGKFLSRLSGDFNSADRDDLFAFRINSLNEFLERTGYEYPGD